MIFEGIQSIIQVYSMPILYAIVAWFAIIGFAVRTAMVMILTRVKSAEIVPVSLKLHIMSLIIAYLVAPVCTMVISSLNIVLFPDQISFAVGLNLYIWYSLVTILSLRYLLCQIFVSVSCSTWQITLICTDSFVAILGYVFLSALRII